MRDIGILALAGVGILTLLRFAYLVLNFLAFHVIKPSSPLKRYKRSGPEPTYALVTGASAGIGLGVAQALVKQRFGVILLGHLPDELAESAERLRKQHPGASVETLVLNARTATAAETESAVRSVSHLQISVLVNNVGGNPVDLPAFRALGTYSCADVDAVIDMNARFMARLTALVLPILSRKPSAGQRSLILNVSSLGKVGVPWLTVYGATKAFNWGLSCGLARELEADPKTSHVDCLAIVPGEVRTQSNNEAIPANTPSWDVFGQCIVEKVDGTLWRNRREIMPFWLHDLQYRLLDALPEGMRTNGLMDMMIRKRDGFNAVYEKSR